MTDQTLYAFPGEFSTHFTCAADGSVQPALVQYHGMTLRDYFAGQALAGMSAQAYIHSEDGIADCATDAYALADAMLAARSVQP